MYADTKKLILICYGGQDRNNPSTNYHSDLLFLTFKFDEINKLVYQEATKSASSCQPHSTAWKKNTVLGAFFPPLSMTGLATIKDKTFMWGGLELDSDIVSEDLFVFSGIRYTIKTFRKQKFS